MLCDRILGNLQNNPEARWAGYAADYFDIYWHECGRRALRKVSRAGRTIRILLPPGVTLNHDDVLAEESETVVAVNVVPMEVLVIRPRDLGEMAAVALEIGNLHAPAAVTDGALLVVPDGPVSEVLARLRVPHDLQLRRFIPLRTAAIPAVTLASQLSITQSPTSDAP